MSFIDDIVKFGKDIITGNSIGSQLAKTALLGYTLSKLNKSVNRENNQVIDPGSRVQVDPSTENKIPVIYGETFTGAIVTDAILTNNNQTMFFCLTICEKTGTKISDSQASAISFINVYYNDEKLIFRSDGVTANKTVDRVGTANTEVDGLIKVYLFSGDSDSPVLPSGYNASVTDSAYDIMPGWTSNHTMDDLVFAIIRIDYNKEKNVTGLGKFEFQIKNTMTLPGDCLYDMMTNTRYGAGIDAGDISVS